LLHDTRDTTEDHEDEYDAISDEQVEVKVLMGADGNGSVLQGEIGSSATFLLGARPQFGKVVGFNNRSVIVLRRLSLQDPL